MPRLRRTSKTASRAPSVGSRVRLGRRCVPLARAALLLTRWETSVASLALIERMAKKTPCRHLEDASRAHVGLASTRRGRSCRCRLASNVARTTSRSACTTTAARHRTTRSCSYSWCIFMYCKNILRYSSITFLFEEVSKLSTPRLWMNKQSQGKLVCHYNEAPHARRPRGGARPATCFH